MEHTFTPPDLSAFEPGRKRTVGLKMQPPLVRSTRNRLGQAEAVDMLGVTYIHHASYEKLLEIARAQQEEIHRLQTEREGDLDAVTESAGAWRDAAAELASQIDAGRPEPDSSPEPPPSILSDRPAIRDFAERAGLHLAAQQQREATYRSALDWIKNQILRARDTDAELEDVPGAFLEEDLGLDEALQLLRGLNEKPPPPRPAPESLPVPHRPVERSGSDIHLLAFNTLCSQIARAGRNQPVGTHLPKRLADDTGPGKRTRDALNYLEALRSRIDTAGSSVPPAKDDEEALPIAPHDREPVPTPVKETPEPVPVPAQTPTASLVPLIEDLNNGLRLFFDRAGRGQEETTGAIGFLIQHALTQLLLGTLEPFEPRRTAMFANLYAITDTFKDLRGMRNEGFERAWDRLESGRLVSGAPGLARNLPHSPQPTRDYKLFLSMRQTIRTHARREIPYFYAVDEEGLAHGFG